MNARKGGGGRVFQPPPHQTALVWVVAENFLKGRVSFFWWRILLVTNPQPRVFNGASKELREIWKGLPLLAGDRLFCRAVFIFRGNFGVEKNQ